MKELEILEVIENNEILLDFKNKRSFGGSCALVGNSGNLMDEDNGKFIDTHDFIIRCNEARVEGFESKVGSRTDIRMANSHLFHAAIENTTLDIQNMTNLFSKFERYFLYTLKNESIIVKNGVSKSHFSSVLDKLQKNNNNEVIFLNQHLYNYLINVTGNHPTTGFIGLLIALKYFDKINCFGFSFFKEEDWSKKHYYEDIKPYDISSHNFEIEEQIFKNFVSLGKINMYPSLV